MNNKNTECGGIIINHDLSKLLIVFQRASQKWGLPKGHMNYHEIKNNCKRQCAEREVLEETGIDLRKKNTGTLIGKENMNNKLFYIYKLNMQQVKLNPEDKNEISDIKWYDIDEIDGFVNEQNCNRSLREFNRRKSKIKRKLSNNNELIKNLNYSDILNQNYLLSISKLYKATYY